MHRLPLPTAGTAATESPRLPTLPALWRASLMWIAGMALCLLAALATVPRSAWVDDPSQGQFSAAPAAAENAPAEEVAAVAEAAMAQVVPAKSVRARLRCETCGVVESIERTEAVGAMPSVYKLTVRLRNGSRVTTAVGNTVGRWKVGDKIMIIGGA